MNQKNLMRRISLILLLCVMITILPAYKAQATAGTYGVTIWTTDGNFVRNAGPNINGSGTSYLTEMKKFYEDQNAFVNVIDGGNLSSDSLNGTNLLWVVLPSKNFNADDITYMGNFLATGGRIVFCGEHPGFFAIGDSYITKAVSDLGGSFSIKNTMHAPTSGTVTGAGLSQGSSLTDGVTGFFYAAAAEIGYSGKAQIVLDALDGLPLVIDQPVGKGRITLFTDINTWDPVVKHESNKGNNEALFANLMKDAKANQDTVATGGDPNSGYGHERVTIPTADLMNVYIVAGSTVTLSTATTGATIHFTTNSTTPNVGSTTSSSVTINGTVGTQVVVKAIATKADMNDSEVATFTYRIVAPKVSISSQSVTGLTAGDATITGLINSNTYNAQIVSGSDVGKYVSATGVIRTSAVSITGVTEITGLTNGIIYDVREQSTTNAAVTYTLNYTAENGGTIAGQLLQIVDSGEDGNVVTAVPNSKYRFVKWSDGKTNASRKDIDVEENIDVSAIFKAKSSNSSNSSSNNGTETSSSEQVTVNVTDGSNDKSVSKIIIEKIKASDGTKKNTVTYTLDKAKETIAELLSGGKDVARILAIDKDEAVSETKINIPKDTLSVFSSGNVNLEIETNGVRLLLPKTLVQDLAVNGQLSGDLYFRVVPINDVAKQQGINATVNNEMVTQSASRKDVVQGLGTPVSIETNMSKGNVDIVLPLTNVTLPSDPAEREAFLKDLEVFIDYGDGNKVLEKGEILEYVPGVLGVKFTVSDSCTLRIVKLNQNVTKGAWANTDQGWKYTKDGQTATGWNLINSHWYLMDPRGIMETGWKQINGTWYLLNTDGSMITGWKQVNGNWYYLYEDGSMASNTVVDDYAVDESGALVY